MKIDVRPLSEGQSTPFSYALTMPPADFAGRVSFDNPVAVEGTVTRRNGLLTLSLSWRVWAAFRCDRCDTPYSRMLSQTAQYTLIDGDTKGRDDMAPLTGDTVNIDDIVHSDVILSLESKNLCAEDCNSRWIIEEV